MLAVVNIPLRAFATLGYAGTSIRELNQQLGVSHNLLNRRFGSKEQLWRATVDNFIGEVVTELKAALCDDEADSLETLRRLIVTFIEVQARRPEIARLMNVESSIDDHACATCTTSSSLRGRPTHPSRSWSASPTRPIRP